MPVTSDLEVPVTKDLRCSCGSSMLSSMQLK